VSSSINRSAILWAVGILQPVSAAELNVYLAAVLPEGGTVPSASELQSFLLQASDMRQVVRVARDPDIFSLTLHGNYYLTRAQRLSRDRERLFLLRDSWHHRLTTSLGEAVAGSGGAAPSSNIRTWIQGSGANKIGPCVPRGRSYWPRISRQLIDETGPFDSPSDTFPDLLSFASERQLELARNDEYRGWDFTSIGLAIGVSPRLLMNMKIKPERHYRSFDIRKANGTPRTIDAPRVFLKAAQKFIGDYILFDLPVHECVHSFVSRRSPVTNALIHMGASWVGTIDVEKFFPSISAADVESLLRRNGFDGRSARTISILCTYKNALPQGAPSSPIISNALLFEADKQISAISAQLGARYTRYADDLTFSGSDRSAIERAMQAAQRILLDQHALKLNPRKSRIIGPSGRRVVTGATVNDRVLPSRKLRREIRAAAFNLSRAVVIDPVQLRKVEGYLSYFGAFPDFRQGGEAARLATYLARARSRLESDARQDGGR